jgi:putative ABC transport system substrate-binding protein
MLLSRHTRRREFIAMVGGAVVWPLAARAQQSERIRRIGVLMNRPADDVVGAAMVSTFKQSLQQLGWRDGHNIRMDVRWGANDLESERRYAVELNAVFGSMPRPAA